ncbi:MAG: dethiobiotin synthase [Betaproteobacteria bacterium]
MTQAWFVTGTDTEIGKTFVCCALLHAARARSLTAVGMKPVAAGVDGSGANEDVEALAAASSLPLAREAINPYLFRPPIAPHIAAAEAGVVIEGKVIRHGYEKLASAAEVVIVEGVGGFRVPLGPGFDAADLAVELALPVILVVGMRLGCINHALLTAEAIERRGLRLAGWVANQIQADMPRFEENIAALSERINAPLLGRVPYLPSKDAAQAASCLSLP